MTDFSYIDSNAGLSTLCERAASADFVALDTEFIRTDTFYPIAGLVQVGVGGRSYLIDPLEIDDWAPLVALFADESLVKVIHSCSEDLEVFQRLLGCLPRPLLDTQIGAALAGLGGGMSYQRLVEAVSGVHVEKGETRSDWLQRPLSDRQCLYAALDVDHLQGVYQALRGSLERQGRLQWWWDECEQMMTSAASPAGNEGYYLRVKGGWKLRGKHLLLLQRLCEWREQQAQEQDVPRGRVLKDQACFDIALKSPGNVNQLAGIKEVSPKLVRRHGEGILDIVSSAMTAAESEYPLPIPAPPSGDDLRKFKSLREFVQVESEKLSLPPELVLKKKEMESLVRDGRWPDNLPGWRKTVLGDGLGRFLKVQGA
ncbi:ribonuclease D [Spongiibacter taiwanensis]|uniref:ribonuclease D n=1 Tax=Spongiibacter taiwanensis TaxID=1748242 RepID=UPI00203588AF|nr:ribonuclease D [Spongiibacter taiwanensis]USA43556.1 ribonuclease D [Spongiibacter taiwanensis]